MALKVYQGSVIDHDRSTDHHGQCRCVVAANSWAEAHRLVSARYPSETLGHMKNYWSVTSNYKQIAAAMCQIGKVLVSPSLMSDDYE